MARLHLLALLLGCAACQSQALRPISDADRKAIQSVADSALAFANQAHADWPGYVRAYYAEDAISMPAGTRPQVGAAAILTGAQASTVPFTNRWQLMEIEGYGDLAYVRGRWWVTVPTAGPAPVDSGNYLEIWRRQPSGAWRVARDMYGSEVPPKPAAASP